MGILDIKKDDLTRLSSDQLAELIFRLAQADVVSRGYSPACVDKLGHNNAPDGGIDIRVKVETSKFDKGFLVKPNTILQSKKSKMPKNKILKEMRSKNDKLRPAISNLAENGGSYIIVSLEDPACLKGHINAMKEAVSDDQNKDNIDLQFFGLSKLHQWLDKHLSVVFWLKSELGQDCSGWYPYGLWSNPYEGDDDSFISAPGISVQLLGGQGWEMSIEDAFEPMCKIIRSSYKITRIIGLSGVGKTRIVQAIFDKTLNENAIDRKKAIYTDIDTKPVFSAHNMLDRLIAEDRKAIMIVDNCPPDFHSSLASKVSTSNSKISLITIDYDIKDDLPDMTEVIKIKIDKTKIAEKLLLRRFSYIEKDKIKRIVELAGGNIKVSLAIANRSQQDEIRLELSDENLLDRILLQRNKYNDDLREQSKVLSLVYSFSDDDSELKILGSICGYTEDSLRRTIKKLKTHGVIQDRSNYQTIFPDAIANRLAALEIKTHRIEILYNIFKESDNDRLSKSFASRLKIMRGNGLIKDHDIINIPEELRLLLE